MASRNAEASSTSTPAAGQLKLVFQLNRIFQLSGGFLVLFAICRVFHRSDRALCCHRPGIYPARTRPRWTTIVSFPLKFVRQRD